MKLRTRSCITALVATTVSLGCTAPALADLVFRISNQSDVEAKGVVQNVQVLWLKRGQTNDIRIKGEWGKDIQKEYVVNFENLANAGQQYCVWKLRITGPWQKQNEQNYQDPLKTPRYAKLEPSLDQHNPAFSCETGGQYEGRYEASGGSLLKGDMWHTDGQGATIHFILKSVPKK
jgi:hypothetical protein